jgi:hypothetical protein
MQTVPKKNGTRINYVFIRNEIALLHHSTFILFYFYLYCTQVTLYGKNISKEKKYQVHQTKVNNNYIIVNKNFIDIYI